MGIAPEDLIVPLCVTRSAEGHQNDERATGGGAAACDDRFEAFVEYR